MTHSRPFPSHIPLRQRRSTCPHVTDSELKWHSVPTHAFGELYYTGMHNIFQLMGLDQVTKKLQIEESNS